MASGPRVKLVGFKRALTSPVVYSTDRSKAAVPMLVLLFVALWFIPRGDLFYVLPCVILFLCISVLLALRLPRLGKRELILVLFIRLFDLCLFEFVGFLFLLVSGKGFGLWLWHSLDFSLTFFSLEFTVIWNGASNEFSYLSKHSTKYDYINNSIGIIDLLKCYTTEKIVFLLVRDLSFCCFSSSLEKNTLVLKIAVVMVY